MSESTPVLDVDVELMEDQLDAILHELTLSIKWGRPSILFALYATSSIRDQAQQKLEESIFKSNLEVVHYQIEYEDQLDLSQFIADISNRENVIFFIDPLNSNHQNTKINLLISELNSCREYMIDNRVRVVFWMTPEEALSLAHASPDFWASRHRVFEFLHEDKNVRISARGFEPVQTATAAPLPTRSNLVAADEELMDDSALVLDFPEFGDSSVNGINLLLMMGVGSWKDGDLEKARESLNAALKIAENSKNNTYIASCLKAIALVNSDLGKISEAVRSYLKVIELGEENVTIWNNIGKLFLKAGKYVDAKNAFNNALSLDATDPISWNGMGSMYAASHKLDDAVRCFKNAIQYNAGYVKPWLNLGDVLVMQNRSSDALYAYLRCVEMDQKNVHAWGEIGKIYFKTGSYLQAAEAYKKAIKLGVSNTEMNSNLADALVRTGQRQEAVAYYHSAVDLEPDKNRKGILLNKLGDLLNNLNDAENADAAYDHAANLAGGGLLGVPQQNRVSSGGNFGFETIQPAEIKFGSNWNVPSNHNQTSFLYETTTYPKVELEEKMSADENAMNNGFEENMNKTEDSTFTAMNQDKSQPQGERTRIWNRLGDTYLKAGAVDQAIDVFKKSIRMEPDFAENYSRLAQAFVRKLQFGEAIAVYRRSMDLAGSDQEKSGVLGLIADLHIQLKDYSAALDALENAINLNPGSDQFILSLDKIRDSLENSEKSAHADIPLPQQSNVLQGVDLNVGKYINDLVA